MTLYRVLDSRALNSATGIANYLDGDIFESDNWIWDVDSKQVAIREGACEPVFLATEEEEAFEPLPFAEVGNYVTLNLSTGEYSEEFSVDICKAVNFFTDEAASSSDLFALLQVVDIA
jgi:hypothetical protein